MTRTVSIDDLQKQIQNLLLFAMEGNEVIITKGDQPVARIVPLTSTKKERIAGLNKTKIWISEDFDEPLPEDFWAGTK